MQNNIKKVISLLAIVIFIIVAVIYNCNTSEKKFKKDGILYALSIDGVNSTSFPSKGLYKVNVTCENAIGKWLYDDWKLSIENITGDVSCDLDFTTTEKSFLNTYIMGLVGTTQGIGQLVNENGYRYEGKNPNNYIWFNNEYWRIIGVFDSTSHGQSEKNMVKIIRDDVLSGLAWDKSDKNDWSTASLNLLLNGAYYSAKDGINSGYCYGLYSTVTGNCNYTKSGIQDGYRGMIANVTWYLGGSSSASSTADAFYGYERGLTVYSGRPTTTTGYIGLIYPSDYGYSVLSSSCARTTNLDSYDSDTCAGASWLYDGALWTLTPGLSYRQNVFFFNNIAKMVQYGARYGYGVRPVLYLDSSVLLYDGDGSLENPYIIGM